MTWLASIGLIITLAMFTPLLIREVKRVWKK